RHTRFDCDWSSDVCSSDLPSGGRVIVEGQELDPTRPERLASARRRSIGFVFQRDHLFAALTALENVEYALNLRGICGPSARSEEIGRASCRERGEARVVAG